MSALQWHGCLETPSEMTVSRRHVVPAQYRNSTSDKTRPVQYYQSDALTKVSLF